ncbi:S8 family serine peptidase [Candidatus Saccharibacteria bacterium]|nr:S8 family serine peptidase [Candidatus Saccharibacteria bacterium]
MSKLLSNTKDCLALFGVLVICLLCGFYLFNSGEKIANGDSSDVTECSDECMEEFFDSYAEMTASGEQDNMLIVVSSNRPNDYEASGIVEGPNHTYYLMYNDLEKRDNAYEQFANDDTVSVEKNNKMELLNYMSWGIEQMGIDDGIIARGDAGENVKVAVIDTGLDMNRFLEYFPSKTVSVYDVVSNSESPSEMSDAIGHGTHIAGTIAEGTADCTSLMIFKAERDGKVTVSDVNTAIYKAIDAGVDVINLSLGSNDYSESQKRAIDIASANDIVVVAAAGNENNSVIMYPAGYDNTISVAALDRNLERAVWSAEDNTGSNYNAMIDYAAPGTRIRSINGFASGTSVAAPHVTAAVALLKSYNNDLGLDEVNMLLRKHVVDLGEDGRDDYYGYGMIDLNDVEFCENAYCDEYGVFAVDVSIDDLTGGVAEIAVLDDGIMVTADEACMVVISNDSGETYNVVPTMTVIGGGDKHKFEFEITKEVEVLVVLKGDGDMDGVITPRDLNLLSRSLLSTTANGRYRALTELEKIVFDFDIDGNVTPADLNTLNRALISPTLRPYKAIEW